MTIGQMLRFIGTVMIIVGILGLVNLIFGVKVFAVFLIFIGVIVYIFLAWLNHKEREHE